MTECLAPALEGAAGRSFQPLALQLGRTSPFESRKASVAAEAEGRRAGAPVQVAQASERWRLWGLGA